MSNTQDLNDSAVVTKVRDQRGRLLLRSSIVAIVVLLLVGLGACLFYLVQTASTLRTVQQNVADCTTPTGACHQEGQKQTQDAVAIIVEQLQANSNARDVKNQRIVDALKQLCAAQGVTCPSLSETG